MRNHLQVRLRAYPIYKGRERGVGIKLSRHISMLNASQASSWKSHHVNDKVLTVSNGHFIASFTKMLINCPKSFYKPFLQRPCCCDVMVPKPLKWRFIVCESHSNLPDQDAKRSIPQPKVNSKAILQSNLLSKFSFSPPNNPNDPILTSNYSPNNTHQPPHRSPKRRPNSPSNIPHSNRVVRKSIQEPPNNPICPSTNSTLSKLDVRYYSGSVRKAVEEVVDCSCCCNKEEEESCFDVCSACYEASKAGGDGGWWWVGWDDDGICLVAWGGRGGRGGP